MRIEFHRTFRKRHKKISLKIRSQFEERLHIFEKDQWNPLLNNHELTGDRKGEWSINITGDWRAIYMWRGEETAIFIDIDTHSNLYE